jgi:hypothetical protein
MIVPNRDLRGRRHSGAAGLQPAVGGLKAALHWKHHRWHTAVPSTSSIACAFAGKVHDDRPSIDAAADDYERLRSEYLKTVD